MIIRWVLRRVLGTHRDRNGTSLSDCFWSRLYNVPSRHRTSGRLLNETIYIGIVIPLSRCHMVLGTSVQLLHTSLLLRQFLFLCLQ